jgi:tRNA 2-thiouridine synthesizing protein A
MVAAAPLVDARGERCPLPVLRMEKALDGLAVGAMLTVLATDPMARIDIPLFCTQHQHRCTLAEENGVLTFAFVKGASPADADLSR